MKNLTLLIKLDEKLFDNQFDDIKKYYELIDKKEIISGYEGDSGLDLPMPISLKNKNIFDVEKIDFLISCCMIDDNTGEELPYQLLSRSSISKYPLMMANCKGVIDKNYRGNIKAPIRFFEKEYTIEKNIKIFQICSGDLTPFKIKIVKTLSETSRGSKGFGSSGN